MPMELLRELSLQALPLTVTDLPTIDKVRILCAAGHIAAFLPPLETKEPFARVLAITKTGHAALQGLVSEPG